ncbi:efflux transporter outer membrane subunit [Rickettsiales bacterium LUAb2]
MKKQFIILTFFALILLSSCAIKPKNEIKSLQIRSIDTQEFNITANNKVNWPNPNWWQKYNDQQLNKLITDGLKLSPNIEVAKARFASALTAIKQADSSNKFNIDAVVNYNGNMYSKNGFFPPPLSGNWFNEYKMGLNGSYQFDFWGQNKSLVAAATSSAYAEEANMDSAKIMLTTAIAQNYFNLQFAYANLSLLQRQQNIEMLLLENDKSLLQQGLITNSNQYNIKTDINNLNTQIVNAKSVIATQKNALIALVGGDTAYINQLKPIVLPSINITAPNKIDYNLLSRRADLQAQKYLVEASLSNVDAAKAAFYPTVNITGFAGLDSIKLSNLLSANSLQYSITPGITLPLFRSGALSATLLVNEAQRNEAIANYNQTIVNAIKDVYDASTNLNSLTSQISLATNNVNISQEVLNNSKSKYNGGLTNKTELLQNQMIIINNEDNLLNLKYQQVVSDISLIKALGGGYITKQNNK